MKRINACLNQTIHFTFKEEIGHDLDAAEVQKEYEAYKKMPGKVWPPNAPPTVWPMAWAIYRIVKELPQGDGSIAVKIKKQSISCGTVFGPAVSSLPSCV